MGSVLDYQDRKSRQLPLLKDVTRLKQSRGTDQLEIGALAFRCPTTQLDIESGIEMDRCTFQRIGQFSVWVHCHACRLRHEFKVANGSLAHFRPIQPCNGRTEFGLALFLQPLSLVTQS